MTTLHNRLPDLEEARAAVQSPLYESYWWFTGWNFNRPVIARIGVGVHVEEGPFVWLEIEGSSRLFHREEHLLGVQFELRGPIPLPDELLATPPLPA